MQSSPKRSPDLSLTDSLPFSNVPADRRTFLQVGAACLCFGAAHSFGLTPLAAAEDNSRYLKEAAFYQKLQNKLVQCKLCPRECVVPDGQRGFCRVRENRGGTYYTLVYSRVVAAHIDPIEKKPFFHFLPGTRAFSVASGGCNVNCKFCQNWQISQARPEELEAQYLPPKGIASGARVNRCASVAYTYSEPIVFWDYVMDAAEAGHKEDVRSVMVSNGFIQEQPLRSLCERLDAIKIDLKSFSETYYRDVVRGELKPVLNSISTVRRHGKWLEIVYLTVPTMNDSDAEFRNMARWVKTELGPDVPVHFTRFYPLYLLKNLPPTPVETLERAKAIADSEGLHYVYIGNVPGHKAENTYCPKCRQLLIERTGFSVATMNVKAGKCNKCAQVIPGVWA
ncbi:MAG TPA: AmmeMemoRadiSam system radical SAM enzyme [Terriglobales bacterium]|nr:AmmeMemoRadiSam system radical SAM enzyme [Terriglobales bacterium]